MNAFYEGNLVEFERNQQYNSSSTFKLPAITNTLIFNLITLFKYYFVRAW